MFVKPSSPGLVVRDPVTMERLPDNGRDVPNNSYWQRRIIDGDVVLVTATPKAEKKIELKEKSGGEAK